MLVNLHHVHLWVYSLEARCVLGRFHPKARWNDGVFFRFKLMRDVDKLTPRHP